MGLLLSETHVAKEAKRESCRGNLLDCSCEAIKDYSVD